MLITGTEYLMPVIDMIAVSMNNMHIDLGNIPFSINCDHRYMLN